MRLLRLLTEPEYQDAMRRIEGLMDAKTEPELSELDPEDEALVEIVARAIYAVELARDDNCNSLLIKIGGNPHPSTRIETFEENPESWREYAVAAIRSMRFSPRVREPNCSAQVTASEVSDRE